MLDINGDKIIWSGGDIVRLIETLSIISKDFLYDSFTGVYPEIEVKTDLYDKSKHYMSCYSNLDWVPDVLEDFEGFKIQLIDVDGEHRHDGQLVDYTFLLTNEKGESLEIETSMSLMGGWNCDGEFDI